MFYLCYYFLNYKSNKVALHKKFDYARKRQ